MIHLLWHLSLTPLLFSLPVYRVPSSLSFFSLLGTEACAARSEVCVSQYGLCLPCPTGYTASVLGDECVGVTFLLSLIPDTPPPSFLFLHFLPLPHLLHLFYCTLSHHQSLTASSLTPFPPAQTSNFATPPPSPAKRVLRDTKAALTNSLANSLIAFLLALLRRALRRVIFVTLRME